jgi:hypothetical protein
MAWKIPAVNTLRDNAGYGIYDSGNFFDPAIFSWYATGVMPV